MQRRAATAYVVLLLVVAAGSYAVIAGAESPQVTVGGDAATHANQSSFSVDGRTYTVADVSATVEGEALVRSADLVWTNDSARYTATIDNGSTLTLDSTDFRLTVPNVSSPSSATLTEIQRTDLPNTTINGTTFVILDADGANRTLVPEDQYLREQFGPPEERTLSVGDSLQYEGNETAVAALRGGEAVVVEWTGPRQETIEVSQGSNVTLNGVRHVTYFRTNESVVLTTQIDEFVSQQADVDRFHERTNGLWGVVILSVLASVLLAGAAFMPTKDV